QNQKRVAALRAATRFWFCVLTRMATAILKRFTLKPKPRYFLKVLRSNTFKKYLVVRFIGNCCKQNKQGKALLILLMIRLWGAI
ncbi:hypothetical protein, partial [Pseudanabaena sp. FACHB-1998]|uniref:hypothetical protein n=1 Tax=Pseudanabaena sp. FACHB-1998 TaxID=2692858 RepID=UPI001A7EAD1D